MIDQVNQEESATDGPSPSTQSTTDELSSKRPSFNDSGSSSSHSSSSLPVKKRRFKSGHYEAVSDQMGPTIIASPEISDVLLGKGSTCFNHIGNRRFRILVEINVDNYFNSDITASKVEDTTKNTNAISTKQDDIINSVLSSIQGNSPPGRFLLPYLHYIDNKEDSCGSNVKEVNGEDLDVMFWKVASKEEVRKRVHSTFLAAGRFFIKKDHIVDMIERRASQLDVEVEDGVQFNDDVVMPERKVRVDGENSPVQSKDNTVLPKRKARQEADVEGTDEESRSNNDLPERKASQEGTGDQSKVDTMERMASQFNAGCASVQPQGRQASQVDTRVAGQQSKCDSDMVDRRASQNDAGACGATERSTVSSSSSNPFTLNLKQPTSFSRILHTSISQHLSLTNGLGLANNYIPAMVKSFLSIPIEEFFMPDERDNANSVESIPHPAAFIMPSNYDVLCGSGQAFFHHIGNRRFRIVVEMNMERYEKEYQKVDRGEPNSQIHDIVEQINQSIAKCDPPGRFLAMDMNTGWWRVLSPMYSQLKVEHTLLQCMQVKQRAEIRAMEASRQKEEQLTAAMEAATSFYGGQRSYMPKRKKQESSSVQKGQAIKKGQDKSSIFFPSVFGDKDELMKAQEYAKSSLQRKPGLITTTSPKLSIIDRSDNESGSDSPHADEKRYSQSSADSVLAAVSGMITLSRRGSSS